MPLVVFSVSTARFVRQQVYLDARHDFAGVVADIHVGSRSERPAWGERPGSGSSKNCFYQGSHVGVVFCPIQ